MKGAHYDASERPPGGVPCHVVSGWAAPPGGIYLTESDVDTAINSVMKEQQGGSLKFKNVIKLSQGWN